MLREKFNGRGLMAPVMPATLICGCHKFGFIVSWMTLPRIDEYGYVVTAAKDVGLSMGA
jgi:hypothetical protein